MAWETRKGQKYYYGAERIDGRVVKKYYGREQLAKCCAELDAFTRESKRYESLDGRLETELLTHNDQERQSYFVSVDSAVREALLQAGYHQHKGQWRKRRRQTMSALIGTPQNLLTEWKDDKLPARVPVLNNEELEKSRQCDESVLPQVREELQANPVRRRRLGDMASKALRGILSSTKWGSLQDREAVLQRANEIRLALAGPNPNPLEVLIAERAAVSWLEVYICDMEVNNTRRELKLKVYLDFLDRRRTRADKRFLSVLRTLAVVRRLKLPEVMALVQVNNG